MVYLGFVTFFTMLSMVAGIMDDYQPTADKSIPLTLHFIYYDSEITDNRTFARGEKPLRDIVVGIVNANHSILPYYRLAIEMHMTRYVIDLNIGKTIETFFEYIIESKNERAQTLCGKVPPLCIDCFANDSIGQSPRSTPTELMICQKPRTPARRSPTAPLFFGPEASGEAKVIGQLTPIYNLVSISSQAVSAELNNREKYPNFFRTITSSDAFVNIPRALLTYLNYTTVGLVYLDGALGADTMQAVDSDLRAHQFSVLYKEVYVPGNNDSIREFGRNARLYDARVFVMYTSNEDNEYKMFCSAIITIGEDAFTSENYFFIFLMVNDLDLSVVTPKNVDVPGCTQSKLDRLFNGTFAAMTPSWDKNAGGPIDIDNLTITELREKILELSRTEKYGDENITMADTDDSNANTADAFWTGILALDALDKRLRSERPISRSLLDFTFESADIAAMLKEEITKVRFRGATGDVQFSKQTGRLQVDIPIKQYIPGYGAGTPLITRFNFIQQTEQLEMISSPTFATSTGQPPPDKKPPPPPLDEAATRRQLLTIILIAIAVVVFMCSMVFVSVYMFNKRKLAKNLAHPNWLFHRQDLLMRSKAQSQSSLYGGGSVTSATSPGSRATQSSINETPTFPTAVLKDGGLVVRLQEISSAVPPLQVNENSHKILTTFRDNLLHVNVVRFVGYCLFDGSVQSKKSDGHGGAMLEQYLMWEHCEKGTLEEFIDNAAFKLDATFENALLLDVAEGMAFLHQSKPSSIIGGAHGKLTPAACFIDRRFSVKVADYGEQVLGPLFGVKHQNQVLANRCAADDMLVRKDLVYCAPEMLRQSAPNYPVTLASDVYSFAMIVYALTTRISPFESISESFRNVNASEIIDLIKTPQEPPLRPAILAADVSLNGSQQLADGQLVSLMQRCWSEQPSERPTFTDIVQQLRVITRPKGGRHNVSLTDQLLGRLEKYASDMESLVAERTRELEGEKRRSDELLNRMLPSDIVVELKKNGKVQPESFDSVTIYFRWIRNYDGVFRIHLHSDIVGFTTISATSSPIDVVNLLNALYTVFDAEIDLFDAYKVETIGDAYMVVSGLPRRNGNQHTAEIAKLSLALLAGIKSFVIPHRPMETLKLRIGLHTGPCVAGVVGIKMPRYCLFGDTVNTASRMESNGEALKIHVSHPTKIALDALGGFHTRLRGQMEIKGKGNMETYWLVEDDKE